MSILGRQRGWPELFAWLMAEALPDEAENLGLYFSERGPSEPALGHILIVSLDDGIDENGCGAFLLSGSNR